MIVINMIIGGGVKVTLKADLLFIASYDDPAHRLLLSRKSDH